MIIDDLTRPQWVRFKDGAMHKTTIHIYEGACLAGDPTAFAIRGGETIWLRPTSFGFAEDGVTLPTSF